MSSNPQRNELLRAISSDFHIDRGYPEPLGATLVRGGVNFSLFSKHATQVSLVLFQSDNEIPIAEFPLDARYHKTGDIWHALILGLDPGIYYAYRVDRQPNEQPLIHRFNIENLLLDPYAKAIDGLPVWRNSQDSSATDKKVKKDLKCVVVNDDFDWGFDQPLNVPLVESVIYELHVRGFTRHPTADVAHPGTFAGLMEKIPYIKSLGVTAVELLPITEFDETDCQFINPLNGNSLLDFWGYNPINYFSPKASYASNSQDGAQVLEFKTMVKAFHNAGVEVILDVVFNHTGEGGGDGVTSSFRGIDNAVYYITDKISGEYHNYSGCGNTFNCNHPVVRDLILDCLHYWVTEMHVDGFRFDLASILGRSEDGSVLANPPLLERIAHDPILANTKLIAEAWDAAGLYQVGSFPSWGRWAEWNGKYRDDIRSLIRGEAGMVEAVAKRLQGSPDLYQDSSRQPYHSINFVTCHDGFTLFDLVRYDKKHNELNGEENRDGCNDNRSWNCGHEGEAEDKEINRLRSKQTKNIITLLMFSHGVPMLLAGDEFCRTQGGNNNAYCQDNELAWLDWSLYEKNTDMFRFFSLLIAFRKTSVLLKKTCFDLNNSKGANVEWHGVHLYQPDWSYESRTIALHLSHKNKSNTDEIYLIVNSYWEDLDFELPVLEDKHSWSRFIDTSLASPDDIRESIDAVKLDKISSYHTAARSVVVLLGGS